MWYSAARKPIKFACRENKPLLFSRNDQSTVNRLHLPHLSLFLRAEKQQFRRSLNDNKGTMNGPDLFISPSREKIYFRRRRERREISEACETRFTSSSMFSRTQRHSREVTKSWSGNFPLTRIERVILPYLTRTCCYKNKRRKIGIVISFALHIHATKKSVAFDGKTLIAPRFAAARRLNAD